MRTRMRRLRRNENLRRLVRETAVSVDDLIYPMFATHETGARREIGSMPGCYQFGVDVIAGEVAKVEALGVPAVLLFGLPEHKDEMGADSYSDEGVIQKSVRAIKSQCRNILVITDVCFCEYTSHGHCGVLVNGEVDNDRTLELLAKQAASHARAGADVIAPSDMMDGRVGAIREALDGAGFEQTPIMAYAAKYASAFYGPFREAAESAPQSGDRKGYQMDPPNRREAMREIELDIAEGADIIMVKPALAYLDVIAEARARFDVPIAAYNVSGEYSMVKAAGQLGWLDEKRVMMEVLTSIKRAGADMILTYHALEAARIVTSDE